MTEGYKKIYESKINEINSFFEMVNFLVDRAKNDIWDIREELGRIAVELAKTDKPKARRMAELSAKLAATLQVLNIVGDVLFELGSIVALLEERESESEE